MIISIVSITFNNYKELVNTITSLPGYNFIEPVIINGGDDKLTKEFLKSFKGKSVSEKDAGIADAFNKGIKNSSGDAIMFLNSGDFFINHEYLMQAAKILTENPEVSFVHSNLVYEDLIGGELIVKPSAKNFGRGVKYLHPTMIVRKEVFQITGGFNTEYKIAMDFDFFLRMEQKGFKGYYLDGEPVVKMEGSGRSHTEEFDALKECFRSLKENNALDVKNFYGFSVRLFLFFFRKLLLISGGKKILRSLKRKKYNPAIF